MAAVRRGLLRELKRGELCGGGVFGELAGLPAAQLAVLPGTTHVGMLDRAEWLLAMIPPFLDAPVPRSD